MRAAISAGRGLFGGDDLVAEGDLDAPGAAEGFHGLAGRYTALRVFDPAGDGEGDERDGQAWIVSRLSGSSQLTV